MARSCSTKSAPNRQFYPKMGGYGVIEAIGLNDGFNGRPVPMRDGGVVLAGSFLNGVNMVRRLRVGTGRPPYKKRRGIRGVFCFTCYCPTL